MADMGLLKTHHQRSELRQCQPLRHLAAQHAALGIADLALAGDDQHEGEAFMMRALLSEVKNASQLRSANARPAGEAPAFMINGRVPPNGLGLARTSLSFRNRPS